MHRSILLVEGASGNSSGQRAWHMIPLSAERMVRKDDVCKVIKNLQFVLLMSSNRTFHQLAAKLRNEKQKHPTPMKSGICAHSWHHPLHCSAGCTDDTSATVQRNVRGVGGGDSNLSRCSMTTTTLIT